jgi:hypothetical protein
MHRNTQKLHRIDTKYNKFGTLENLLEKLLQRKFKKLQGDFDDLKILASNMSAERKKFSELSCRLCEGIKKEWLIKNDK